MRDRRPACRKQIGDRPIEHNKVPTTGQTLYLIDSAFLRNACGDTRRFEFRVIVTVKPSAVFASLVTFQRRTA